MCDVAQNHPGNPSSQHSEGRAARHAIEQARAQVASLLGAQPSDLIFTSGGSEANNCAILGTARAVAAQRGRRGQILSSALEHPSVRAPLRVLAAEGWPVVDIPCDGRGRLDIAALTQLLKQPTDLVSLALCNHELGNVYPIADLAALVHTHGALFHCDAVQAVGRIPVSVRDLDIDLLSLSAHKLFGPKGVGALYIRPSRPQPKRSHTTSTGQPRPGKKDAPAAPPALPSLDALPALIHGGPQERGRRAGTENVLGIVGLGAAAGLAEHDLLARWQQVRALRDDLEAQLLATVPGTTVNGDAGADGARSPGTSNLAFTDADGELLLMNLDLRGIAVSTGAACSSGSLQPSPVLLGLGQSAQAARRALRISLGPDTTSAHISSLVAAVGQSVALVRAAEPGAR